MNSRSVKRSDRRLALSSVLAAIGAGLLASACCLGPLAAVLLGIGGAWASSFSALEPYRPLFAVVALGALGLAWYREVQRSRKPRCNCQTEPRPKTRRLMLGLGTVLVLGFLLAPSLIERTHPAAIAQQSQGQTVRQVVLTIKGMTCTACSRTISLALRRLDGVKSADVTFRPPRARVRYDTTKISVAAIVDAVRAIGYDASPQTGVLP
ncbi:MAG: hypothetical protein KatS3mg039_0180 [Candidatus Kapaibacterium sp.]|nr:MAG: hypothetical protein KatS3mg039_0180 [Candidatus Kapabacteria bacterium]